MVSPKPTFQKTTESRVIWVLKKISFHWCCWKDFFTLGRLTPKTSIAERIFEEVSLLYFDIWSIQTWPPQKQQNLNSLSSKSIVSLLLLFGGLFAPKKSILNRVKGMSEESIENPPGSNNNFALVLINYIH